jgi:hypothetical protein
MYYRSLISLYYYSLISLQPTPISEVAYVGQVSYLRDAFQAALPKFSRCGYAALRGRLSTCRAAFQAALPKFSRQA